jgi:hypothetical protein
MKTTMWLTGCGLAAMALAALSGGAGCSGSNAGANGGASTGTNAGSTGPGAGTGGSGTGCSAYPGAVFCDDFETASTFDTNWPLMTGTPPTVTMSPTAYSPTHVASALASADGGLPSNMGHPLPMLLRTQRLRVAFSFRVLAGLPAATNVATVSLHGTDSNGFDANVDIEQGKLQVELLNDASPSPPPDAGSPWIKVADVSPNEWVRLELDVDVSDQGSVRALVNGAPIATLIYSPAQAGYSGTYQGDLLLTATAAAIDYDDVVLWMD